MKFLVRALIGLALLIVILIGAAYFLLQDPNRFKPEIEAFIAEQTGVNVSIDSDLSWQLFPPIAITAGGISAEYEGAQYRLEKLTLDMNLMSVIRSRDIDQWEVTALNLDNLVIEEPESRTDVAFFRLENFKPATPSPFAASLTQTSGAEPPLPLELKGLIAIDPDAQTATLTDTRFETTEASGVCNLDARYSEADTPPDPEDAIIPVSVFRTVDWSGTCNLDRLTLEDENFTDVAVTLQNSGGKSSTDVRIPEFFGGSASAEVDIDASKTPVRWRIRPDLARADSEALMAWLDQRLKWIAPVAYSGEITMTGNTEEELIRSIKGKTTFDGGKGRIDITQIKQPLLNLATLFQSPERIAAWPDLWNYQRLVGEWVIDGTHHKLDLALDNLTAAINGDYDPLSDALDMNVQFLFEDKADQPGFDVNPVLVGLAIPLRCAGTMEAPKCSVTKEATRNLVAAALTSEEGAEVRQKIDQKIDEEVPEQYREAARGLLDLLGKSMKKEQEESPQPTPQEN